MNDTLSMVMVALVAIVVGAALPVLLQLYRTLKSAQAFLETTGRRMERTLDEVADATGRLNRVGAALEEGTTHLWSLFQTAAEIGAGLRGMQESIRTVARLGAAVGPAIAAAIRALIPSRGGDGRDRSGYTETEARSQRATSDS
jgi:uncharacterized protein YoxC